MRTTLRHRARDCTLAHMKGLDTHNTNNLGCLRSSGPKLELTPIKILHAETDLKTDCGLTTLRHRT